MAANQVQVTESSKTAAQQNLDDFLASVNAHVNGDFDRHNVLKIHDVAYPVLSIPADQSGLRAIHNVTSAVCLRLQVKIGTTVHTVCIPAVEVGVATGAGPGGAGGSTAPIIYLHPTGATIQSGSNATLSVSADGTAPLLYQWRKDGVNIAGETGRSMTVTGFAAADVADYTVLVYNTVNQIESNVARLDLSSSSSSSSSSWSSASSSSS